MFFFCSRDTTIINHSPCHSSNNSFNEDLPVADHRNQEMENRCIPTIYHPPFWFQTSLQNLPLFFHPLFGYQHSDMFFLLCIRIRALYAQILEKDAVIKILNQRLHQDQGRKDEQSPPENLLNAAGATLRSASSTPSISPTKSNTKTRGEEHRFAIFDPKTYIFVYCWKVWNKKVHMLTSSVTLSRR